jgi:hypothetical protein
LPLSVPISAAEAVGDLVADFLDDDMKSGLRTAILTAATLAAFTAPVLAQRPALAMLRQLEAGRWELRVRDADGSVERLCLPDVQRLIQLRHPAIPCERLVIDDGASEVTVQYTCRGHGYGRTNIRRETNRLVQIQTQGIVDGRPFSFAAEARRVGDCPS